MNSEEAYAIWAPVDGPWSPWVKPVLFANEREWEPTSEPELMVIDEPTWLDQARTVGGYRDAGKPSASPDLSTAFVVDLPGAESVAWGAFLATKGWRPVPLYNALHGGLPPGSLMMPPVGEPSPDGLGMELPLVPRDTSALVDVQAIVFAMRRATPALSELALAADRAPVFMLDSDRRFGRGVVSPGRFDNRSISLPTDFPSAVFLRARGIERVVLVQAMSTTPQEDLAHTLLAWQQGGVAITAKALSVDGAPAPIEVTRPSQFRALWYRFLATMGLRRNPLGGFGGTIPLPSAG